MMKARLLRHLWVIGLVTWFLVTWAATSLLPGEPGPYRERPFAKAVLLGGLLRMTLLAVGLAKQLRRLAASLLSSFLRSGLCHMVRKDHTDGRRQMGHPI